MEPEGQVGVFPCLSSNISTGKGSNRLSVQARKSASALAWNVKAMAHKYGLERLGFLTLTFRDPVTDIREAQRRFNSLASHVLRSRYEDYIAVVERQKSGRIHFHLIVALPGDIRTGFDFSAIDAQDYRTASPYLRSEWAFWRRTARLYGFGRTELLPIRSTEEGIARYVGKYIGKHMAARLAEDKGARLVRYSNGCRMASCRFSWATEGAALWRLKVKAFAWAMFASQGVPPTMKGLATAFGPRWAYRWRDAILSMPV